mmetsp:Transcript_53509/g.142186  ORF Transcript_53509/g.142186 Transcript_53509/m.142186 type:complete len:304 (-) Transcript_53509:1513-2424(-)
MSARRSLFSPAPLASLRLWLEARRRHSPGSGKRSGSGPGHAPTQRSAPSKLCSAPAIGHAKRGFLPTLPTAPSPPLRGAKLPAPAALRPRLRCASLLLPQRQLGAAAQPIVDANHAYPARTQRPPPPPPRAVLSGPCPRRQPPTPPASWPTSTAAPQPAWHIQRSADVAHPPTRTGHWSWRPTRPAPTAPLLPAPPLQPDGSGTPPHAPAGPRVPRWPARRPAARRQRLPGQRCDHNTRCSGSPSGPLPQQLCQGLAAAARWPASVSQSLPANGSSPSGPPQPASPTRQPSVETSAPAPLNPA